MNRRFQSYIIKAAFIAALVFIAVSCLFSWGEYGVWANAELNAAFGYWRVPLAGMLSWLIWIIMTRQRKMIAWMYAAAVFLFTGASLNSISGGGYGYVLDNIAAKITHGISAAGLYIATVIICVVPFMRRRGGARGTSNDGMSWFKSFFENYIKPELDGFEFFIDGNGVDWRGFPAECRALQELFEAKGIDATVTDVNDGLNTLQYIVRLEGKSRVKTIENLRPEIAMTLNENLNSITVSPGDNCVVIAVNKVSKCSASFVELSRDYDFMRNCNMIPIGKTDQGEAVYSELDNYTPHLLVAGTTRSGKTTFLQALITALAMKNNPGILKFLLIAGSSDGFVAFVNLPHLAGDILYDPEEIEKGLTDAVSEMDKRAYIRRTDINARFSKLVVVIDEIDGIIERTEKGVYGVTAKLITRLAKESGKYNMSLVLGTQKPTGNVIPAGVLSCINSRVCLQVASSKFSRQIIDVPDGARLNGRGDLLYSGGGALTRCQGYYITADELKSIADKFKGQHKRRAMEIKDTVLGTSFQPQSVVDMDNYRQTKMETLETLNSPTHTQNNIKSTPPDGNKHETRVETETETENTADIGDTGGYDEPETETETYTDAPADILRMYYERSWTMRKIAKHVGRSPKYVFTVIDKNRQKTV